jgi:ATP-binding cassette subfamily F protein uup
LPTQNSGVSPARHWEPGTDTGAALFRTLQVWLPRRSPRAYHLLQRRVPVVSARHVSKAYGAATLFSEMSLTVRTGERVGLIGNNGTGKSTLLRIVAGLETADSGVVERRRERTILYLPQEPVLDPTATPRRLVERGLAEWHSATQRHAELTRELDRPGSDAERHVLVLEQAAVAEKIELLGGWAKDHVAIEMLEHLGVRDVDREVGSMSGGERRRVALAELLVAEPSLAILDEPTNHLDTETVEWLETYLADEFRGAVLLVTHDRYVLDAIADRIIELENGRLTEFAGGYADYLEQKAELVAHAERVEQNRLNLLRRERAWLLRGAKARTTKQKARIQRAEALERDKPPDDPDRMTLAGLESGAARTGKSILDLGDLGFRIDDRVLIGSLTLHLVTGDRIGVIGPNGAGKTSLLRLAAGELEPSSGTLVRGANTRVVYFDQARSGLVDEWSVFDNVAEREGALRGGADVVRIGSRTLELRTYLEQFLFDAGQQRQKVGSLSGGERARVALAKALRTGANLLLLDEPTNDLDVSTLGALEELLSSWPGVALVVSHDRYFLDRVATSILAFEGDGVVTLYPGGYESYRRLRDEAALQRSPQAKSGPEPPLVVRSRTESSEPTGPKPLSFAERKELDGILREITALETRVQELEARLADPTLYGNPDDARRTRQDHASAQQDLARRTARWEELEARRDVTRR